jgi:hypothetical protein
MGGGRTGGEPELRPLLPQAHGAPWRSRHKGRVHWELEGRPQRRDKEACLTTQSNRLGLRTQRRQRVTSSRSGGGFSSSTTDQANSGPYSRRKIRQAQGDKRGRLLDRQSGRDARAGGAYLRSGGKQCDVAHLHPNFPGGSIGRCLSNSFNTF